MKQNSSPSYYFDFTFETSEAHWVDLEWISNKMGLRPSETRLKGEEICVLGQVMETKFTRWSEQSKVYKDWNMDKNFEKFVAKFYKKQKHILQILQTYPSISALSAMCQLFMMTDFTFVKSPQQLLDN